MPATIIEQQESRNRTLARHLRALGLRSPEEYREWYNRHGFRRKLHKGSASRRRELKFAREQRIQSALRHRRFCYAADEQPRPRLVDNKGGKNTSPAFEQLLLIRRTRDYDREGYQPRLHRRAALKLIRHLESQHSKLLTLEPVGDYGMTWLETLATISAYHKHWLRPIEDWRSGGYSVECQFRRLIKHLFVRYDEIPACLECCWQMLNDHRGNRLRDLFLHLGAGKNVRHWSLPIPYTKKMSHHFMHAPDNILPVHTIRWGQVRGLGVKLHHAVEILKSRLGELFENEEFWLSFFHWLADHPDFDERFLRLVIDYVHYQRFVPRLDCDAGPGFGTPAQPNLSMHRRDPQRLIEAAQRWQRELEQQEPLQDQSWGHAAIVPFAQAEEDSGSLHRGWTIRQLMTSDELVHEGRVMDHCVATYISSCLEGTSTIWTLEYHVGSKSRKLLTIEVDPRHREVIQVRGRSNREANEQERRILENWARAAYLRLTPQEW
ncbi:MAG: PcfJ domain-containing protein [Planctomycetaceae bacterium]|nr:PcfJ domain-containing protein [Planctomycetaceae bacterium]